AEPYKYVLQPLPDVWIPFNDSLDMITGFSPSYKKIVNGVDEFSFSYAKMRTKDNMTGQSSALNLHTCSASRGIDVSGDN
ncbi:hypothetical protein UZF97_24040, partial [Escherichia coli]|nr:hypothetical protein [Escherichia coli]